MILTIFTLTVQVIRSLTALKIGTEGGRLYKLESTIYYNTIVSFVWHTLLSSIMITFKIQKTWFTVSLTAPSLFKSLTVSKFLMKGTSKKNYVDYLFVNIWIWTFSTLFFTVAPKVDKSFTPRDVIAKVGEPFKIVIPYNGNPIPDTNWSIVSTVTSWVQFFLDTWYFTLKETWIQGKLLGILYIGWQEIPHCFQMDTCKQLTFSNNLLS